MPRFHTFLFDLDGTLIDHFTAIHRCYAHTLPQLGLPAPSPAQVRRAVGGGLEDAMLRFVPKSRLAEAVGIYRAYWHDHLLEGVEAMPGATDLLTQLAAEGAKLGVLTNKLGESARLICGHLGWSACFTAIIGAGDTAWLKPEAALTHHALAQLGAGPDGAVLIGDSPYDVDAAHHAGIPAWTVSTGTHDAAQLRAAGAEAVFPDLAALGADLG